MRFWIVERWILAALRHRKFFALAELNEAIEELLERLNHRPFPQTRRHARFLVRQRSTDPRFNRCRPNAT